jgi:hypothetical protein
VGPDVLQIMTLLDAKPPKPITGIRKYVSLPTLLLIGFLVLVLTGLASFRFWNYPEERAVSRFLVTLEEGKFREAYKLWQPAASYTYENFVHDWGEKGDYGSIREFDIVGSRSQGSIVIVTIRINHVNPPLELVVDRKTMGLAYSNF